MTTREFVLIVTFPSLDTIKFLGEGQLHIANGSKRERVDGARTAEHGNLVCNG